MLLTASGVNIGDPKTLIRGYERAVARFHEARLGRDPVAAFIPLFEALNWAVSIDEGLGYLDHPQLQGMRYARNRVHHQWADALYLTEGRAYPVQFPVTFFEWRWRETLPPGRSQTGAGQYRDHLAVKPARETLDAVAARFATV